MPLNIVVCAKQVIDPEMPASAFKVDADSKRVAPATGIPPVINGFDENAVEAALRLKEEWGGGHHCFITGQGISHGRHEEARVHGCRRACPGSG